MSAQPLPHPPETLEELCEDALELYPELTDIHLDLGQPPMYVVQDRHIRSNAFVVTQRLIDEGLSKLNNQAKTLFEESQDADGRFKLMHGQTVRMHCYAAESGPALALRIQPKNVRAFHSLGLPDSIRELLNNRQGLIIFSGPTGSGKTTAMHSLVDYQNRFGPEGHIYTIEDPPEYSHDPVRSMIHQREIGVTAKSYRSALEGAMRVRPSLIVIGEMRRVDEMDATMQMITLGHLAMSSIHTTDTSRTMLRILQSFPVERGVEVREIIRNHLLAIVSVRLVPTIDGKLTYACEILTNTTAIQTNLESTEKVLMLRDIIRTSPEAGMQTLESDLVRLENNGIITADTAYEFAIRKDDLDGLREKPSALAD